METELATYAENIYGNSAKDREEEKRWEVGANQAEYDGAESQENPKHDRGSEGHQKTRRAVATIN